MAAYFTNETRHMIIRLIRSPRPSRMLMLALAGVALQNAQAQPGTALYTIPVVFHVLHENGSENIADAQIADAINILNTNYDAPTWNIEPPFDTIAGDMDISFVLATVDPDGNPATGIDRIATPLTENAGAPSSYLNPWPRNRYLNIWVVRSLADPFIAYTTLAPALADGEPCTDGIMIYHSYVGSIGTASIGTMRSLTQAVGRFYNLKMLYADPIPGGNCGDDDVADTPRCEPPTCLSGPNPCDTLPVNERNFMFSPYATNMFTEGQRTRVHACLNSTVAQRNELATGTWTTTTDCSSTGILATDRARIAAYPVPFTDHLFLTGLHGRCGVELLDLSGRTVFSSSLMTGQALDVPAALACGSYVLLVNDGNMNTTLGVVKQ